MTNQASGSVTTDGDRAHALYAQSIGGGGGAGGGAKALVGLGGSGGAGGDGGSVTVTNNGGISTGKVTLPANVGDAPVITGDGSTAIYAQSVGGGGGAGGGAGGALFARGLTLHAGYSGRVSDHLRSNAGAFAAQAAMTSSGYDGRVSNGPGSNEATLTLSMPLQ